MRLLHTSDWHLGRTLHGVDLLDVQREALDQIVEIARSEQVDAVLISGDVYDRAVPPVEAVSLFAECLSKLTSICQVVVSSGNHDSAIRLGFGAELFTDRLHVRTKVADIGDPVVLTDEFGDVLVYPIPYLDPDTVRGRFGDEPLPRSHEAVMAAAMSRVQADIAAREAEHGEPLRSVVMAHAFVGRVAKAGDSGDGVPGAASAGDCCAVESDSERDLRVGGIALVPSSVFEGIHYTALGHLHGAQEPKGEGSGILRYSGSPLRYSFSEAAHTKSVTLVDLGPEGVKSVSTVGIAQPRPMVQVEGPLADLLDAAVTPADEGAWVKAVVTDAARPDGMREALVGRFPHLLSAQHQPLASASLTSILDPATGVDPMTILAAFVEAAGGRPITDEERGVLRDVYEGVVREQGADR